MTPDDFECYKVKGAPNIWSQYSHFPDILYFPICYNDELEIFEPKNAQIVKNPERGYISIWNT